MAYVTSQYYGYQPSSFYSYNGAAYQPQFTSQSYGYSSGYYVPSGGYPNGSGYAYSNSALVYAAYTSGVTINGHSAILISPGLYYVYGGPNASYGYGGSSFHGYLLQTHP